MSDLTKTDSRRNLAMSSPPPPLPISKDMQRFHAPIPLSPQWLLSKPGDAKQGSLSGDHHSSPSRGNHSTATKTFGGDEEIHDAEKKRDIFRPSARDAETGWHDRWHDEEREVNSCIRKDRWRDGEKEVIDPRRAEIWSDTLSKQLGEGRRIPSDRRSDTVNRDKNNDQRRESKWNTRWGPDNKETDGWRDKGTTNPLDQVKDGEWREKGIGQTLSQVNDGEKGGHYSRPWRSNSLQAQGRGDSMHPLISKPNKQSQIYSHVRGRGERCPSFISSNRGKSCSETNNAGVNNLHHHTIGNTSDFTDGEFGKSFVFKYSRINLLDMYRMDDVGNNGNPFGTFTELSLPMQTHSVEPLAFSSPTSEEMVILNEIDKGEVISSGPFHNSKDGSHGTVERNPHDSISLRSTKQGFDEYPAFPLDDLKDNTTNNSSDYIGQDVHFNNKVSLRKKDDVTIREGENTPCYNISPWRSQSAKDRDLISSDGKEFSSHGRTRSTNIGWQDLDRERESEQRNVFTVSPKYRNDKYNTTVNASSYSETSAHSEIHREVYEDLKQERTTNVIPGQPNHSPEYLSLYYKDPNGKTQGPFSGDDLIGWFETGYFGIDLQVRLADAPMNAPFTMLGDVMPHLRYKTRPPPGFVAPKQVDVHDFKGIEKTNSGIIQPGLGEMSGKNMENRYLESLMTVQSSNSSVEPSAKAIYEAQQLRLQQHSQQTGSTPPHSMIQPADFQSISHDPQVLNILQQKYLMSQLNIQPLPPNPPQLSILDKLLLLKQQQEQEQEQKHLLLQQQQNLLSQVLSGQTSRQHVNDQFLNNLLKSSFSGHQLGVQYQQPCEGFQISSPMSIQNLHEMQLPNSSSVLPQYTQGFSHAVHSSSILSSPLLPNQIFNNYSSSEQLPDHSQQNKNNKSTTVIPPEVNFAVDILPTVLSSNKESGETVELDFSEDDRKSVPQPTSLTETKISEGSEFEVKRVTDKKNRKQKNLKPATSNDSEKGLLKETSQSKTKNEINNTSPVDMHSEAVKEVEALYHLASSKTIDVKSEVNMDADFESKDKDYNLLSVRQPTVPQAWKAAAPGFKAKSLLEIQEEQQQRAKLEKVISGIHSAPVSLNTGPSNPWEKKPSKEIAQSIIITPENAIDRNGKKNFLQLNDGLAAEVLSKSHEVISNISDNPCKEPILSCPRIDTLVIDDDFVEAKDSRRNRKKTIKEKLPRLKVKASVSVPSADTSLSSPVQVEKGKNFRIIQQEQQVVTPLPLGSSLGDFVISKGEQSSLSVTSAAWSTASKVTKPTPLKDILKEQEKKVSVPRHIPLSNPVKVNSWNVTGSSPSKSNIHVKSCPTLSKPNVEHDLFWGPPEKTLQDSKSGLKSTPIKVTPNRQKSAVLRTELPLSSPSGHPSLKGRAEDSHKQSEAAEFRQWCEDELIKLTGSKDTHILEFCMKQSTSEAKILLTENLARYDRDHTFIEKFLNFKEMLSSDVIEMAFNFSQSNSKSNHIGTSIGYQKSNVLSSGEIDESEASNQSFSKSGGSSKKKGRKAKKVSSSVLGFNVVSNRIMKGEIQTVED